MNKKTMKLFSGLILMSNIMNPMQQMTQNTYRKKIADLIMKPIVKMYREEIFCLMSYTEINERSASSIKRDFKAIFKNDNDFLNENDKNIKRKDAIKYALNLIGKNTEKAIEETGDLNLGLRYEPLRKIL